MTSDDMKVSKGLGFSVVALPGVGHMPAAGEDEADAARVFYVAATTATKRLVIGVGGDGGGWDVVGAAKREHPLLQHGCHFLFTFFLSGIFTPRVVRTTSHC